jgi:hypothetical protein
MKLWKELIRLLSVVFETTADHLANAANHNLRNTAVGHNALFKPKIPVVYKHLVS